MPVGLLIYITWVILRKLMDIDAMRAKPPTEASHPEVPPTPTEPVMQAQIELEATPLAENREVRLEDYKSSNEAIMKEVKRLRSRGFGRRVQKIEDPIARVIIEEGYEAFLSAYARKGERPTEEMDQNTSTKIIFI